MKNVFSKPMPTTKLSLPTPKVAQAATKLGSLNLPKPMAAANRKSGGCCGNK